MKSLEQQLVESHDEIRRLKGKLPAAHTTQESKRIELTESAVEESHERLVESFQALGLSEKEAAFASEF